MLKTRFTAKYGSSRPLVSAGMSTMTTPRLVGAVCEAGGIGLHWVADMPPDRLRRDVKQIRQFTSGPFGVAIIPRL